MRDQIFANQKRLGVILADAALTPWPDDILKTWDKLSADENKLFARQAEVFAAYAAYTDHEIGRVIQAVLLDKGDPSKVLARSREPLVRPEPSERKGYVPNVVYTCGAMRHNDQINLPYAVSDTFCNFATIKIAALMQAMES